MRRTSPTYKLVSLLAIIFIMAGTTGFVVSSHTCSSCGTQEEMVAFFGATAGDIHVCTPEGDKASSCCAPNPEKQPADCCSNQDDNSSQDKNNRSENNCSINGEEPCCQYETGLVIIETVTTEKSRTSVEPDFTYVPVVAFTATAETESARTGHENHYGHLSAQADITRLVCCYRL